MKEYQPTRRHFLESGLIFLAQPETVFGSNKRNKVCLDPGHGMGNGGHGKFDPGCIYNGLRESDIVLDISDRLGESLEREEYGVCYTRRDNEAETSLSERTRIANASNSDIFVSLHCNSSENRYARRVETIYFDRSKNGKKLAASMQDNLVKALQDEYGSARFPEKMKERILSTKELGRGLYVLKATKMPACLVEIGFLSNDFDANFLKNKQDVVVNGLSKGILKYFK